jgi:sugar (pentulose or hexulose) kinase
VTDGVLVAVDLGASSGRVIAGRIDGGRLALEEVHRFPNHPVADADGLWWDVDRLTAVKAAYDPENCFNYEQSVPAATS